MVALPTQDLTWGFSVEHLATHTLCPWVPPGDPLAEKRLLMIEDLAEHAGGVHAGAVRGRAAPAFCRVWDKTAYLASAPPQPLPVLFGGVARQRNRRRDAQKRSGTNAAPPCTAPPPNTKGDTMRTIESSSAHTRRSFIRSAATMAGAAAASGTLASAALASEPQAAAVSFDEEYDVVVIGAGMAGCAAAVTVATEGDGATCLIAEKCSAPMGNTPFANGTVLYGHDVDAFYAYMKEMAGEHTTTPDDVLRAYAEGACGLHEWIFDEAFYRPADTLEPVATPPFYAQLVVPHFLNTDGGPVRSAKGEILDTAGNPIPGLYSAGEFGSVWSAGYNGGGNIAEGLIFGRIAARSALGVA